MEPIQVITSVERRRRYSDEEKIRILDEAKNMGSSLVSIARRYGISPSLLHLWRKKFTVPEQAFLSVNVPSAIEKKVILLRIGSDIILELPKDIDPKALGAVLRELRR